MDKVKTIIAYNFIIIEHFFAGIMHDLPPFVPRRRAYSLSPRRNVVRMLLIKHSPGRNGAIDGRVAVQQRFRSRQMPSLSRSYSLIESQIQCNRSPNIFIPETG